MTILKPLLIPQYEDDGHDEYHQESIDDDLDWYSSCTHGIYKGYVGGYCDICDNDPDIQDIDKCLNCGRYKANSQLDKDQVCIIPCRNPAEY